MNQLPSTDDARSDPPEEYDSIRDLLLGKPAHEIGHELPGLIESVKRQSVLTDDTLRFVIGVSFTKQGTCFDFWLDRVVDTADRDVPKVASVKEPINADHRYVTFEYPPDPDFDAGDIRAALLTTIEANLHQTDFEPEGQEESSLMARIRLGIGALMGSETAD